jgi:4-amino-4-deoxy-L-arabinose transferase-like glycosyltransferase
MTLRLFPGRVFSIDVSIFQSWCYCLKAATGPIFTVCSPFAINYPTIGLWASAGALWALEILRGAAPTPTLYFQYYLAVFDTVNIVLMYLILRGLGVKGAPWLTLLFSILPSTRVGASLWGQIDTLSQFFLSLGFLCGLYGLKAVERAEERKTIVCLTMLGLCITLAALTKQLVIFSLPALGLLWLFLAHRAARLCSLKGVTISGLVAFAAMVFLDQLSTTPPGYLGSSLYHVFATGSNHGSVNSAAGVNLYPLLNIPSPGSSKSAYSLFSIGSVPIKIIPLYFGLVTFSVGCAMSAWWLSKLARAYKDLSPSQLTTGALAVAALCNLFMNTVIAGTHERYLYHYGFFVFPVLCVLTQKRVISRFVPLICLIHLSVYGVFVFSLVLAQEQADWAVRTQKTVAACNIALSLYALWKLRSLVSEQRPRETSSTIG